MSQQLLTGQMLLCAPQPGLAAGEKLGAALKASPLQCAGWGCQELWGCAAGMELPLRRDVPDVLLLAECWCVCTFICKGDVCGGCVLPYVKLHSPGVQLNEEASRRAEICFVLLKLLILALLAILYWLFIRFVSCSVWPTQPQQRIATYTENRCMAGSPGCFCSPNHQYCKTPLFSAAECSDWGS